MRDVYPTKYYSDEGFVERKVEIKDEDLAEIIEAYLISDTDIDFDEVEVVNNRPMNIWLHVKCRKYVDPEDPESDVGDADVEVKGAYDDNPLEGW